MQLVAAAEAVEMMLSGPAKNLSLVTLAVMPMTMINFELWHMNGRAADHPSVEALYFMIDVSIIRQVFSD